jgi:putative transposase
VRRKNHVVGQRLDPIFGTRQSLVTEGGTPTNGEDRIVHIWEHRAKWIALENIPILEQKNEYIHQNPLQEKWKLAKVPEDYFWSSASYYVLDSHQHSFVSHYLE